MQIHGREKSVEVTSCLAASSAPKSLGFVIGGGRGWAVSQVPPVFLLPKSCRDTWAHPFP